MRVPKLGLVLSQNFRHSYLFQIKSILKIWRQYPIALKKIFSTCITCTNHNSFDPYFQGFVVGSQIPNLTIALFINHNSCKSCLNEQCEGTLSICASKPFGPIWCLFAFPMKAMNIRNFSTNATPKVGVHLGVIGFHPLHSPPFLRVCFTPKQIFLGSWALALQV
jgi:hypothetical protein